MWPNPFRFIVVVKLDIAATILAIVAVVRLLM